MVEQVHSISLVDFDTQSAGAELSVAADEITVNAVNKIAVINRSESRLFPYNDELWYVRFNQTGIVQKLNQVDLSDAGIITLQWTGLNAQYNIHSICVVGDFIYGLVKYRAVLDLKAVGKWDFDGNLIGEFIDYVNPPADGELWNISYSDMVTDGTYLYITQVAIVGGERYIKKFDLTGNFVAKCNIAPIVPVGVCLGQDGYLYATNERGWRTAKITSATMVLETLVNSYEAWVGSHYGHIDAIDDDHIYKLLGPHCVVSIQSTDADNDYRGAFGSHGLGYPGEYTVATGRPAGSFQFIYKSGMEGYYLFISDLGRSPFENVIHKIYTKENRTVQTSAPAITGEDDLKNKLRLVNPSYLRLAIQEDPDGDEITYYRSINGTDWTEITRDSGFDLSGHNVTDPLYLKIQLDNLFAKVGDPKVYGIEIVAEGTPIPTLGGGLLW